MFRSRKSRESRSIDPGALVAANTIGKALVPSKDSFGGQVVDKSKIPRYNSISGRSYSMVNSPKPSSRRNSVRHASDTGDRSSRYGSMRSVQSGNRVAQSDADKVFHEFGGNEAKYVPGPSGLVRVDNDNSEPKMVSRYIPSSHGLVKVEVPLEQYEAERRNSLRRSTSLRGGMTVRNSLSNKRSHASLRANSIGHRTPSGTPLKRLTEVPAVEEKKADITHYRSSPSPVPRITKTVYATTAKETSAPVEELKPPSFGNGTALPQTPERAITKDLIDLATEEEQPKIHTDLSVTKEAVEQRIDPDSKQVVEEEHVIFTHQKEVTSLPDETVHAEEETDKESLKKAEHNTSKVDIPDSKEKALPGNEGVQETIVEKVVDEEEHQIEVQDPIVAEPQPESQPESQPETGKSTLAQYIRSANPELQRVNEEDTLVTPKIPLEKTPSPIKSAMKKTNHNSQQLQQQSQASSAYLSLTTKENTRLNAQLSHESLRETASKQQAQHQHRRQQQQNHQPLAPKRNSQRPQSMMAQRVNGDRRSFMQNNSGVASPRDTRPRSVVGKPSNNAKSQQNSGLYPREPPQKRSSFEKQRPMSTNLGFKNLSLREDPQLTDQSEQPQAPFQPHPQQRQSRNSTPVKTGVTYNGVQYVSGSVPLPASNANNNKPKASSIAHGFKSRFADSDSDEESANLQFSNQGSRSTQVSSEYEPAPPPPAPYNPHATLRPQPEPQINATHTTEKKKKNKFSSKLKKLFGTKKH